MLKSNLAPIFLLSALVVGLCFLGNCGARRHFRPVWNHKRLSEGISGTNMYPYQTVEARKRGAADVFGILNNYPDESEDEVEKERLRRIAEEIADELDRAEQEEEEEDDEAEEGEREETEDNDEEDEIVKKRLVRPFSYKMNPQK